MKNFYDFFKMLSESNESSDEFFDFILKAVQYKQEERNCKVPEAADHAARDLRLPLTNTMVKDYGDMIRFLITAQKEMRNGQSDPTGFSTFIACVPYFYLLASKVKPDGEDNFMLPIFAKYCKYEPAPEFIREFRKLASRHGFNFGSDWKRLFVLLVRRSPEIFDDFINLLNNSNMSNVAEFIKSTENPPIEELPDFNKPIRRFTKANPKRKHWTISGSSYMNPDFIKLIVPFIPENVFSMEQLMNAGTGVSFGPHRFDVQQRVKTVEHHSDILKQMEKYDNMKFGTNPARDEMIILDLAARVLDVTDNSDLFDGGDNTIGIFSTVRKLFEEISTDDQNEAVERNKLPLSNTEISVLNFFYKGLRNAMMQKVLPFSLAITLFAVDIDVNSDKSLIENKLAERINRRKEKLSIDINNKNLDFDFYIKMARSMCKAGYVPYFTVKGFLDQIKMHDSMKPYLKKIVNETKQEYGISGF